PGSEGNSQVIENDASELTALRRNQRYHPVEIDPRIPRQIERHDEYAHAFDDELDASLEVRHQRATQKSKHLVERASQQTRRSPVGGASPEDGNSFEQPLQPLVEL